MLGSAFGPVSRGSGSSCSARVPWLAAVPLGHGCVCTPGAPWSCSWPRHTDPGVGPVFSVSRVPLVQPGAAHVWACVASRQVARPWSFVAWACSSAGGLWCTEIVAFQQDVSPRGRGNRFVVAVTAALERSIPAWAGEPLSEQRQADVPRVYPRVGGGTSPGTGWWSRRWGLSPRGRGNHTGPPPSTPRRWSIPAWAGEPRQTPLRGVSTRVYPRVGGGTPQNRRYQPRRFGLSPRGRGNRLLLGVGVKTVRSIPAWAGEPVLLEQPTAFFKVYPRVGGGTVSRAPVCVASWGLSPRGRGNPVLVGVVNNQEGSIPAWAGEPEPRRILRQSGKVYPRVGGGT